MKHLHDVVVIGGGIAGTLAVHAAASRGLDVAWVADRVGPDAQSAHWHGHLHRGRLYDPVREADLIEELGQNVPFWWSNSVVGFHTPVATVALGHDPDWATSFRRRIGGPAEFDFDAPSYARQDVLAVRTDEAVLDGPAFLGVARDLAARDSTMTEGVATGLRRSRGTWEVAAVSRTGEPVRVAARHAILATGTRNPALTPQSVRLSCDASARLSRMLVLRGRLPRAAAIIPSRAAGGLFFDSREIPGGGDEDERVWLVSDGFSSPGTTSPSLLTDAWWACSVIERLLQFVRADLLDGVEVGGYRAPKSRVESSPTEVPARGFAVDRDQRFASVMPSKWSASPTTAVQALDALIPDELPLSARIAGLAERFDSVRAPAQPPFAETWESVESWVPLADLARPGIDALMTATRIFPGGRRSAAARSVA